MPRKHTRNRPSRERILQTAERVFAKRGYGETSLRDLMSAAGVSTTAFYARYDSKQDVMRALVVGLFGDLQVRARSELSASAGLHDGFVRGVDVLVAVLIPKRDLVRLTLTEAQANSSINEMLSHAYAGLAEMLSSRISELGARGRIAAVDSSAVAWALVGALNLQVQRWAVWNQLSNEELAPALRRVATALMPTLGLNEVALPMASKRRRAGPR